MGRQNYQQRQAAREARGGAAGAFKDFKDWYTNGYNPTAPSPGWIDSRQASNNAIQSGKQLAPRRPEGVKPGEVKPVPGAVDARTGKTAPTTAGRTNQSTRTNALGVTQSGTNTGAINMPGLDMTGIANFNGPSFPTQAETNKITSGQPSTGGNETPASADDAILYAQSRGALDDMKFGASTDEALLHAQGNGGLDGFKPGGPFAGAPTATEGLSGALADTSGLKYDASKYKGDLVADGKDLDFNTDSPLQYAQSGEEMRRRAAFLGEPDSMKAMQNVAAGMGMGNQGTRNFANVDGKAVEMSSEKRREILQAAPGEAQALKDKWVQALKTSNESEPQTASSAQNPTVPSGTSTFNQDRKLDLPKEASAVDFMNDNADDDFGIGGKSTLNKGAFGNSGYTDQSFDATNFYLK